LHRDGARRDGRSHCVVSRAPLRQSCSLQHARVVCCQFVTNLSDPIEEEASMPRVLAAAPCVRFAQQI
jgi:hypothetical protein